MLIANNVAVQPSLLLKALPWEELRTPEAQDEMERIMAWQERGHFVDPKTATSICKKVGVWLALSEMSALEAENQSVLDTVSEVMEQSDTKLTSVRICRDKIRALLKQDQLDYAHQCAMQQMDVLDQVNATLEDARARIERASQSVWGMILNHLMVTGGCLVVYFGLEFIGTLPGGISLDSLSCLQDIALDGGLLCLTEAAALFLSSVEFTAYMDRIVRQQAVRQRMHQRLTSMVHEMLLRSDPAPVPE